MGKMFLVIMDAHSKWMDVHATQSATSSITIEKLQVTFGSQGLPDTVVTDNGTNFCSEEFEAFLKQNGIIHIKTRLWAKKKKKARMFLTVPLGLDLEPVLAV